MEQDWLLIFDNADGDARVVAKYMPTGNRGNVLFTSRNPDMGGRHITRETSMNVENMCEKDAISLLLKSAWLDESSPLLKNAATPIVHALNFFPLAIDQAGAAIKSGPCTIHDYLGMYAEHRQRLMSHSSYAGASNYGRAVYATWDLSFAAIEAKVAESDSVDSEAAKGAILILCTFAFFHHADIREEIIKRAAEARPYPVGSSRRAAYDFIRQLLHLWKDGSWDPLFFREGIRVLLSFSLIKRNMTGNVYSMHPLVHFWCQDRMSPEERQCRCISANMLLSLSITFQFADEDYVFRRTLIPHINANQDPRAGNIIPYDDRQYDGFGLALSENGFWKEAENLQVKVMNTRREVLGAEHPDTLNSMTTFAAICRNQGRWKEAERLEVQIMETRRWVFGVEHPETLTAMAHLAETYKLQGLWQESERLEVQVMEMSSQVRGAKHPYTLIAMCNLASTQLDLRRWKEAEELLIRVIQSQSQVIGVEHKNTLVSMGNLVTAYHEQGRLREAEELGVQVMETRGRVLGAEHPETLTSMSNLALIYWDQGRLKEVEELQVQVMEMMSQVLGAEHPDTLIIMAHLAHTWKSQERDEEAIALMQKAVKLHVEKLGSDHPYTVDVVAILDEWES
jgi:tetratricopeptide (TPR) repeat protein